MLTMDDVARILRVSKYTVYRMIKKGKLRAIKIGRLVRIPEKEIQRLVGDNYGNERNKKDE